MEHFSVDQLIQQYGWFATFGIVFFWGLAMNLTPCVYPLIPITVSYFGGMAEGKRGGTFLLALLFVLGMATTYSILGVTAALTGKVFGASLGNVWVIAFVSAVLVLMGLSLLGVWQMTAPSSLLSRIQEIRDRLGWLGSLFFGLVVGIVMAPCVGPFITALLAYVASTRNPVTGFWMFFVLAWGMGLPYLFLGVFAGGLKKLPRPGPWMVWLERLFGCVLLAMALYFWRPFMESKVFTMAFSTLLLLAGLYLGFIDSCGEAGTRWPRFILFKRLAASMVILLALWNAAGLIRPSSTHPEAHHSPMAWQPFSGQVLSEAALHGRPVLIDFYAPWCAACNELDEKTWADSRVIEATRDFVRLKVTVLNQGDLEKDPQLKSFQVTGLPTVIFLDRSGKERKELRLEEFVPPARMLELLSRAGP